MLAPRRLQSMMLRPQKYDLSILNKRNKNMHLADMLSQAFLAFEGKDEHARHRIHDDIKLKLGNYSPRLATRGKGCPELTHRYFDMRDKLTLPAGMIFKGNARVSSRRVFMQTRKQEFTHFILGLKC